MVVFLYRQVCIGKDPDSLIEIAQYFLLVYFARKSNKADNVDVIRGPIFKRFNVLHIASIQPLKPFGQPYSMQALAVAQKPIEYSDTLL